MPSETKIANYKTLLKKLLPRGRLWTVIPSGTLDRLLDGLATELARVDDRAVTVLSETDPRNASELLPDWETELGLPGDCQELESTTAGRQAAVFAKLTKTRSQNKQSFVDIAASLGYEITVDDIIEYNPFVAGSLAGGLLTNGPWLFAFAVRLPELNLTIFKAGSRAGERLVVFGDEQLECLLRAHKPAHTQILFVEE